MKYFLSMLARTFGGLGFILFYVVSIIFVLAIESMTKPKKDNQEDMDDETIDELIREKIKFDTNESNSS